MLYILIYVNKLFGLNEIPIIQTENSIYTTIWKTFNDLKWDLLRFAQIHQFEIVLWMSESKAIFQVIVGI